MPSMGNHSGLNPTHTRATRLPNGSPATFEAEWDTATGRGWYRITIGTPPAVARVNGDRLEHSNLSLVEFQAVCRRWLIG